MDESGKWEEIKSIYDNQLSKKRTEEEKEHIKAGLNDSNAISQFMAAVFDEIPMGILIINYDLCVKWCNKRFLVYIDAKFSNGITGLKPKEFFPSFYNSNLAGVLKNVFQTGEPFQGSEFKYTTKDNKETYWNLSVNPIFIEQQSLLLVTAQEVTDQVVAKKRASDLALIAEWERTKNAALVDALPVGVFVANADGEIVQTNYMVNEIWGGDPISKRNNEYGRYRGWWSNTGAPISEEEWALARAIRKGETSIGEVIDILRFDGAYSTILNSAKPLKDAKGNIIGGVAVVQNITDQKKLEKDLRHHKENLEVLVQTRTQELLEKNRELERSQERFYKVFSLSPTPKSIISLQDFRYIEINQAWLKTMGFKRNEVIGRTLSELNCWTCEKGIDAIKKHIIKKGQLINEEITIRPKFGQERIGLLSSAVTKINDQEYMMSIIQDITELRNYEKEMKRLDKMNTIGEMASGIAHEIRNPMTTVRGFLQLFSHKDRYLADKDLFQLMIDELDRANAIITEFLSLAKNKTIKLKEISLNQILRSMTPLIMADAIETDKEILINMEDIPETMLDEKEIRQLILNLVRNGLEAITPGGMINIRTYASGSEVILEVKDTGCGIPEGVMKKMFQPFITTKEQGTGLGLSVCYSICQRHKAKLDYKTGSDGTTFYIRFPKY